MHSAALYDAVWLPARGLVFSVTRSRSATLSLSRSLHRARAARPSELEAVHNRGGRELHGPASRAVAAPAPLSRSHALDRPLDRRRSLSRVLPGLRALDINSRVALCGRRTSRRTRLGACGRTQRSTARRRGSVSRRGLSRAARPVKALAEEEANRRARARVATPARDDQQAQTTASRSAGRWLARPASAAADPA